MRRRTFAFALLALFACVPLATWAAPPPPAPGPQIDFGKTWVPQGPAPMLNGETESIAGPDLNAVSGAMHTVVAHPTNPDIALIGAVNGGIWRTTNATAAQPNWTVRTPDAGGQAIGAMEYDPTDVTNMTLIAGHGYMSSFGQQGITNLNGLLRSTDGGLTWTPIMDPLLQGENIVSVAARGGTLVAASNGRFGSTGRLMRRANAGAMWTTISGAVGTNLPTGDVFDMVGDPASATRLYCSVQSTNIFRSDDTGAMWTPIGDAVINPFIQVGSNNNLEMAVGPTGRLWAVVMQTGQPAFIGYTDNPTAVAPVWVQMDLPVTLEGVTPVGLSPRPKPGGQGGTHLSVLADPNMMNIVYVGGDRQPGFFVSSIGANDFSGRLFRGDSTQARNFGNYSPQWAHLTHTQNLGFAGGGTANNSSPHADSREMVFDANGNIVQVDDAGIYRRTSPIDNTGDWFSVMGDMQVSEPHDVAYDTVSDILMIGNQDTGTGQQISTGNTRWTAVPLLNNVISGTPFAKCDGGDVNVDPMNPAGGSTRFLSIQFLGRWRRQTYSGAGALLTDVQNMLNGGAPMMQFKTPVELNRVNPLRVIVGAGDDAYESVDQGDNIVALGLAGVNPPGAIAYGGGGNADATYIASGNTVFVRQAAAGAFAPTLPGGSVRDLDMDPNNFMNCAAVDSNQVFWTTNAGAPWMDITGDLAMIAGNVDLRTVAYIAPPGAGAVDGIVVGSQNGVFGTLLSNLGVWYKVGTGLPDARVWELVYDQTDDLLVAATLGRGVYTTPMLTVLSDVTPPTLTCTLARTIGWPPFGGLVPVGLMVTATDNQPPDPIVTVTVYSDEADPAGPFSPDATGTMPADTRLRLQRDYPWGGPAFAGDAAGRVYLVRADAFDAAGNVTTDCKSMIVPTLPYGMLIMMLQAQAMAGEAACEAIPAMGGVATPAPTGYTQALCYTAP